VEMSGELCMCGGCVVGVGVSFVAVCVCVSVRRYVLVLCGFLLAKRRN
jgi:hypothetical protein